MTAGSVRAADGGGARVWRSPALGVRVPPLVSLVNRSFLTGHSITLVSYTPPVSVRSSRIYRSAVFLKLGRFSYAYVLSLYIYFSRKLLAKFELLHLKARCVLFFHRKEFRRKSVGRDRIESLNHFAGLIYVYNIVIVNLSRFM